MSRYGRKSVVLEGPRPIAGRGLYGNRLHDVNGFGDEPCVRKGEIGYLRLLLLLMQVVEIVS